jgi:hypothetical protein
MISDDSLIAYGPSHLFNNACISNTFVYYLPCFTLSLGIGQSKLDERVVRIYSNISAEIFSKALNLFPCNTDTNTQEG